MPGPAPFQKQQDRQAFAERLSDSLRRTGRSLSPSVLAVEFNARFKGPRVHLSTCRKWLMGEALPTQEKMVVLANMLGLTAEWLRYGETSRLMQQNVPTPFDKLELAVLADFSLLQKRDQMLVRQLIGAMLRTP